MKRKEREYFRWAMSLDHTPRGQRLLDYLMKHESITTEEIRQELGEKHPPSAVRDLRDRGVKIVTERVDGIGRYRVDSTAPLVQGLVGRQGFSKKFKKALIARYGTFCQICGLEYGARYLQPDHRVPQRIGGDTPDEYRSADDYIPICRRCNRAKSFECERCPNWNEMDPAICGTCYWAYPDGYEHVGMRAERRLDLIWSGDEVTSYDALDGYAKSIDESVRDVAKHRLAERPPIA